jgi:peptidyl-prolyl cis-trans isomerase SurA
MKKSLLIAAIFMALPLMAQNPPASSAPPQDTPAPGTTSPNTSPSTPPAATPAPDAQGQGQPSLEAPQMAAPEPETEKKPDNPIVKDAPVAKVVRKPGDSQGKVVEEIVARVNNDIITQSELEKARNSAEEDAKQECAGHCTPEQLQTAVEDRQKFALRDLIDQSLLAQRGKDMGISVETDVVKQLDKIRIDNKMKDMDELEKAVTGQGMNWDDFKGNIRNRILTQAVISKEVGSHITIGHDEVAKYCAEHRKDFVRPEQVALRAFLVSTENKKETDLPELKKKADTMLKRVQDGEDFGDLAKHFSDGPTAQQGGYLGVYKRGELNKDLEDRVFTMSKNQMTEVIETKQGYLILQVLEHYAEGEQPCEKVENEIMDRLYSERMEPALREYLKTLREESYVVVKPGYQDMAGGGNSEIEEVATTPEVSKEKKGRKKYLLFGKRV